MRLSVCALLIFCTFTPTVHSQSLDWGIELGIGHSSLPYNGKTIDLWDDALGRYSFNAMVFAETKLTSLFSVQSGIRYNRYGNEVKYYYFGDANPTPGFFQITQHHLSIPIRVKHILFHEHVYLLVGPQIGYILAADIFDNERGVTENGTNRDIVDLVNRFSLSASLGIGYKMGIGRRTLILQALYDRGINPVGKKRLWANTWSTSALSFQTGFVL